MSTWLNLSKRFIGSFACCDYEDFGRICSDDFVWCFLKKNREVTLNDIVQARMAAKSKDSHFEILNAAYRGKTSWILTRNEFLEHNVWIIQVDEMGKINRIDFV